MIQEEHENMLLDRLNSVCPQTVFPENCLSDFLSSFELLELKKGDYILEEGQICKHFYFMINGCVRFYHVKEGQEISTSFFAEEDIFTSAGFISQSIGDEYCEALEDCVLYRMSNHDLQNLYKIHLEINVFGRKMAEQFVQWFDHRMHIFLSMSAKERYSEFMKGPQSKLFNRIPHKYIASYLGVSKETLSRIRGNAY
jgi:CRP-like cAMP-binding protein